MYELTNNRGHRIVSINFLPIALTYGFEIYGVELKGYGSIYTNIYNEGWIFNDPLLAPGAEMLFT